MPWKESKPMDEKIRFIGYYLESERSMAALCREFNISRKTGYKLVRRYLEGGVEGLKDLSRAPHYNPHAVSAEIERLVVQARGDHSTWGPRKLKAWLARRHPYLKIPSSSTIGELLKRHGLVVPRRRSRRTPPYSEPFIGCDSSNQVWCADFKGWFRTGDGTRCDPFTLTDAYSRYLLRCQAVNRTDYYGVKPLFDAALREFGLPVAIRTDNGPPFVTTTLGGLSRLSIEWIKLGIKPERIEPGKPAQNGRHERMHKTLKAETATPPKSSLRTQQQAFNRFVLEYNNERPHEALNQRTPAEVYNPTPKSLPIQLPEITYPDYYTIRKVHPQGDLRWRGKQIHLSQTLAGEYVGLEQINDRFWNIYFANIELAKLDDFNYKILRINKKRKNNELNFLNNI